MQKNYKCNSCGVSFLAEESPRVVCPHCQSDDTEAEKEGNSMKKIVIIAACAFVLAVGVGMLIGFLKKNNVDRGSFDETANEEQKAVVLETKSSQNRTDAEAIPSDSTAEIADMMPFEGLDSLPENIMAEEAEEAAPAASKAAEDRIAKELQMQQAKEAKEKEKQKKDKEREQRVPRPLPEEPAKLPTVEKLTTGQVQALINRVLSTGSAQALLGAKGVSSSVTFDYVDTGGETIPGGVTGLKSGVDMLGFSGYTVVSVGYDAQNKVNRITLRPRRRL